MAKKNKQTVKKTMVKKPCNKGCVECGDCKEKESKKTITKRRPFTEEESKEWTDFSNNTKEEYTKQDEEYILNTLRIVNGFNLKTCKGGGTNVWKFWIGKVNEELNKE